MTTCHGLVTRYVMAAVAISGGALAMTPRCAMTADASAQAPSASAPTAIDTFLRAYCTECHGAEMQKAERRFDQMSFSIESSDALIAFQDILDQLNLGAMPPEEAERRPSSGEVRLVVDQLTHLVAEAQARLQSTGGQTVLRRLNRREYRNTVADLFGLDMTMFDPTAKFPSDQIVMHMDNNGDALRTSGYLLDQYLDAADQVVEKAFRLAERPPEQTWVFDGDFRQQPELDSQHREAFDARYLCLYEAPAGRGIGGYGPLLDLAQGVPFDGLYEIRVKAEAMNRHHPYDPAIFSSLDADEPFRLGIVPGNQSAGMLHKRQPIEPVLAETTLGDDGAEWHTFRIWLDAGYTPRFIWPNGMMNELRALGAILRRYPPVRPEEPRSRGRTKGRVVLYKYGKMPHVRIHEVHLRGPLYDEWPPAGQRMVLGDQVFEAGRTREIIEAFASRAYRRPARPDEIERLMKLVEQRRADGRSPIAALQDGLKAALCSPAFLYFSEPETAPSGANTLPAHALASRLSYFLWSSMPDDELTALARSDELLRREVLIAQTRRMLESRRSETFVAGFLDSWLNLRSLGDMPPDRDAFERYYADDLQYAMRRETQLFARHLLDHNESIVRFLDADFTFANRSLAKLYGMSDAVSPVDGQVFRQVKITDANRGGLLGQGSVLTVSANGVETSPVTRGIWLLENILGAPPRSAPRRRAGD